MKQAFALLGKLGSFTGWGGSGGGEGFIDIRRGSDPQTTWQNNPHGKEKLFPPQKYNLRQYNYVIISIVKTDPASGLVVVKVHQLPARKRRDRSGGKEHFYILNHVISLSWWC